MFINIFGLGSKSPHTTSEDHIAYPRKRSVSSKGVRFDTSRVVYYTHSKLDYDRGGRFFEDQSIYRPYTQANSGRPPVLDSDDEDDSLGYEIIESVRKSKRRSRRLSLFS
ncbi:hypothetical protein K450DRAFT_256357 [Umbelopsis ramanniana AG]|uniref:Uncharacterized protein n=1 Tax=Umbelopsis ramanniana AG TaxID=1314678 RepID=A0AAD5E4J1_UMBRA|nr:uncharacterized protein K450DRAFT_256357 [Umbelopsis ramanniana AG]KAI8576594.1 hypothetical protein K450DRAFT_256357 [Umbelopsis ramanniana AG]